MRKYLILSLLLFVGCVSIPNLSNNSLIVDEVINVYDGDTFRCNINGIHPLLGNNIGIRINGVDTPEMRDRRTEIKELAIKAKLFVRNILINSKQIELRNIQRGKYFRIVADVYCDGINLSNQLIENGLAKPYDGGTKEKW